MAKLKWDETGTRLYETGTRQGALFVMEDGTYATGVAWSGLTGITETPSGAEESPFYADDIKYLSLTSVEEFGGTINAYTYPEEFSQCDGSAEIAPGVYIGQQGRTPFGLAYLTRVGNDTKGNEYGNKLHLIYNAKVSPSERAYETINNDPNALTFSWTFTTTPTDPERDDLKPTSVLTVDSTKTTEAAFKSITDLVFGTEGTESSLPTVDEVITLLETATPTDPETTP